MPTLDELRADIDRLDEVIVRLLNERARCVSKIALLRQGGQQHAFVAPVADDGVTIPMGESLQRLAIEGLLGPEPVGRIMHRMNTEMRVLELRICRGDVASVA